MANCTLQNIDTSFESYARLIDLYHENKHRSFETIEISFTQWFAANLSAALGSILDKLESNLNDVRFGLILPSIHSILSRNGFLSHFGFQKVHDSNNTAIRYLKLKPTDGRYFQQYISQELLSRSELPQMTSALKKKIMESIYEVFVNAISHSETDFIYSCGQFFPTKHKIEFTITDLGIGFKNRVSRRFNRALSSVQAIRWAINESHTTKIGVSGGFGLALLKEFVNKNQGKMQIISDDGFYQFDSEGEKTHLFSGPFPGSIINLQFRTDDSASYALSSEINQDELF